MYFKTLLFASGLFAVSTLANADGKTPTEEQVSLDTQASISGTQWQPLNLPETLSSKSDADLEEKQTKNRMMQKARDAEDKIKDLKKTEKSKQEDQKKPEKAQKPEKKEKQLKTKEQKNQRALKSDKDRKSDKDQSDKNKDSPVSKGEKTEKKKNLKGKSRKRYSSDSCSDSSSDSSSSSDTSVDSECDCLPATGIDPAERRLPLNRFTDPCEVDTPAIVKPVCRPDWTGDEPNGIVLEDNQQGLFQYRRQKTNSREVRHFRNKGCAPDCDQKCDPCNKKCGPCGKGYFPLNKDSVDIRKCLNGDVEMVITQEDLEQIQAARRHPEDCASGESSEGESSSCESEDDGGFTDRTRVRRLLKNSETLRHVKRADRFRKSLQFIQKKKNRPASTIPRKPSFTTMRTHGHAVNQLTYSENGVPLTEKGGKLHEEEDHVESDKGKQWEPISRSTGSVDRLVTHVSGVVRRVCKRKIAKKPFFMTKGSDRGVKVAQKQNYVVRYEEFDSEETDSESDDCEEQIECGPKRPVGSKPKNKRRPKKRSPKGLRQLQMTQSPHEAEPAVATEDSHVQGTPGLIDAVQRSTEGTPRPAQEYIVMAPSQERGKVPQPVQPKEIAPKTETPRVASPAAPVVKA